MKPPAQSRIRMRPELLQPWSVALALMGLSLSWSWPVEADIYECVNRVSGDRVWRNRPCDPSENRKFHQATTPVTPKETTPATPATPATSAIPPTPPTTAASTSDAHPNPTQQASSPPAAPQSSAAPGQSATGNPPVSQPTPGKSEPDKPMPENKSGVPTLPPVSTPPAPPSPGTNLADVDQVLMVAARQKNSQNGQIAMRFQYRDSKNNREIQWESKLKRVLTSCTLFVDEGTPGPDAPNKDKPLGSGKKQLNQGSGLFGSWQESFPLHIPADYLTTTKTETFGRIECDMELPNGKRLHTRTVAFNKIPLTSNAP
ncbi:MAG: hypothetical protein H7833_12680 [Magnetococcus sp. DMHC-1]|nr:hypothetical protein [Magnetococcales bacterium]